MDASSLTRAAVIRLEGATVMLASAGPVRKRNRAPATGNKETAAANEGDRRDDLPAGALRSLLAFAPAPDSQRGETQPEQRKRCRLRHTCLIRALNARAGAVQGLVAL